MSSTQIAIPPSVMWAQRFAEVFLTINLEDCKDPEIKIEKNSIYFRGVGGVDQKLHEVTIPLYKEIDPESSKYFNRGRYIEMYLVKAVKNEHFWPSLTSDGKKHHWLKCDFNKWQDEDESGDEEPSMRGMGDGNLEEMMRSMGGLGGSDADGKPSFDLDANENDSDDEELPDLD